MDLQDVGRRPDAVHAVGIRLAVQPGKIAAIGAFPVQPLQVVQLGGCKGAEGHRVGQGIVDGVPRARPVPVPDPVQGAHLLAAAGRHPLDDAPQVVAGQHQRHPLPPEVQGLSVQLEVDRLARCQELEPDVVRRNLLFDHLGCPETGLGPALPEVAAQPADELLRQGKGRIRFGVDGLRPGDQFLGGILDQMVLPSMYGHIPLYQLPGSDCKGEACEKWPFISGCQLLPFCSSSHSGLLAMPRPYSATRQGGPQLGPELDTTPQETTSYFQVDIGRRPAL